MLILKRDHSFDITRSIFELAEDMDLEGTIPTRFEFQNNEKFENVYRQSL